MENNMRISNEERKAALVEEESATITVEINAKFNTEELMAKVEGYKRARRSNRRSGEVNRAIPERRRRSGDKSGDEFW